MIEKIKLKDKQVVLVGTAHVSEESVKLVKETIESEKPEVVGIELDEERFQQLKQGPQWSETNVVHLIQAGQAYLFLLNLLLANIQRKLGQSLGIKAGSEMIIASEIAAEKNIPLLLLDRSVKVTLKRAMREISLLEKLKIAWSIIAGLFGEGQKISREKIEELKRKDVMSELIKELGREAPNIKKVLVDERDDFIAERVRQCNARKIVAVVGAGHLEGIKARLLSEKKVSLAELNFVPKKRNFWKIIISVLIPLLFFAFIAWAFLVKGWQGSLEVFAYWFLITGVFSAIACALSRAHALSIVTSFVAAPFTTLHPALASGWFAALVEARFRAPKVKDFESLNALNSFKDWQRNNVTHLLMVAAFTNIGSTIGVAIAFPALLKLIL